jgi:DNA invertase Pin-like site-specific DNA recombinase
MILLKRETPDPHIEFVIVDNLDRFGRDLKNMITLKSHFLSKNIQIVAVSQDFKTGTDLGDIAFYQKALEAELFSRDRSIRIKAVKRTKRALGHFLGGQARYGCRVQLVSQIRTVVPDQEEQRVISTARRLARTYGHAQIAQKLNRKGITKRGRQWTGTSVQSILRSVREAMEVDTPSPAPSVEVLPQVFTQMSLNDLDVMDS